MAYRTLKEMREELNEEQIKNILAQFGVEPVFENESLIRFPTCCHNLEGGSPKLYYYKDNKIFRCYTECNAFFDIFTLLIKMYALRNKTITLREAIAICDLDASEQIDYNRSEIEDFEYIQDLSKRVSSDALPPMKTYDPQILQHYLFSITALQPWINEGIAISQLEKFGIKYSLSDDAIVIPNYDINGNLIGVRGRFLDQNAKAKYAPLWQNKICLSHSTGRSFYGIYENQEAIRKKKTVVIFEGEKSVMKYGTYYSNNIALATLGKNITNSHIQLLLKLGVTRVILAYDADYETDEELYTKRDEYTKIAQILVPYFNTSILLDADLKLNYKDSPIDQGKDYFEKLIQTRRQL